MSYADLMQSCEKKFKNDVKAYELERKIRGMPIDLRSKLIKGRLDRPGVEKVYDVISILSFRYRISSDDIYLLEPLVYHVAAVVRRIDACFSICSDILRKADWYITPTMLEHRVKIFSFQDLVELVMPVTYQYLMALKALNDEFLNHIFVGLFFSLMPKPYAYRILDSFLIEGGKILYRYGIALISIFKKQVKSEQFRSGEQFWAYVAAYCHSQAFDFEALHTIAFSKNKRFIFRILSRMSKINRRNINELKNQIREPLEKSLLLTKNSAGNFKLGKSDPIETGTGMSLYCGSQFYRLHMLTCPFPFFPSLLLIVINAPHLFDLIIRLQFRMCQPWQRWRPGSTALCGTSRSFWIRPWPSSCSCIWRNR
jgi:Rab-GTPase-TBC domain